jgi:hypothetical protein
MVLVTRILNPKRRIGLCQPRADGDNDEITFGSDRRFRIHKAQSAQSNEVLDYMVLRDVAQA